MPLTASTRLGPYEILSLLGSGGMGEVYRAKDTKLGRDVALKLLPDSFTHDPERVARFRREAQVLASLNHPHIGAIYGLDEANGQQFLVLELADGESLDRSIARGPIPVDEALALATQIAEALEAAHEKGIIHRDLKPANIALNSDGNVKILDFGLAKATEARGGVSTELANSPTITSPAMMTGVGVILGTAAYMSPEQAKGRPADKRSDVWAFGCVLYEMVTGTPAFRGEDVSDTLANVLKTEANWDLVGAIPVHVRVLLRRCLERDRTKRVSDCGVIRFVLAEPSGSPLDQTREGAPRRRWSLRAAGWRAAGIVALSVAVVAGVSALVTLRVSRQAPAERASLQFAVEPPNGQQLVSNPTQTVLAVSPNGKYLAYLANSDRLQNGFGSAQLMIHPMERLDSVSVLGVSLAREPFFSADSKWVGFFDEGTLKRVPVTGGAPVAICQYTGSPRGAAWGTDDSIVFATTTTRGLMSVPSAGGLPKQVTQAGSVTGIHIYPSFVEGGSAVLFTSANGGLISPAQVQGAEIAIVDVKTGQQKTLIRGGTAGTYLSANAIVYVSAGSLMAVRFDPRTLTTSGDPMQFGITVSTTQFGGANLGISRDGLLAYARPNAASSGPRTIEWVGRDGREQEISAPPRGYLYPRLSPDGTKAAIDVRDKTSEIWLWDFRRDALARLTVGPERNSYPVWTPDGKQIIFVSARSGSDNIFVQSADGSGSARQLTTSGDLLPYSLSPDGRSVVLRHIDSKTGVDLALLHLDGGGQVEPLLNTKFAELNGEVSPDGHWLAYQSDESGQTEVYVRPFPRVADGRCQQFLVLELVDGENLDRRCNPVASEAETGHPTDRNTVGDDGKQITVN